ncbi:hypothetical protein FB451DRAFT_1360541 [Mycena latifolia]|nr:hypothetical protein FB451DRAFT_1360541 [Mycena latifolia]
MAVGWVPRNTALLANEPCVAPLVADFRGLSSTMTDKVRIILNSVTVFGFAGTAVRAGRRARRRGKARGRYSPKNSTAEYSVQLNMHMQKRDLPATAGRPVASNTLKLYIEASKVSIQSEFHSSSAGRSSANNDEGGLNLAFVTQGSSISWRTAGMDWTFDQDKIDRGESDESRHGDHLKQSGLIELAHSPRMIESSRGKSTVGRWLAETRLHMWQKSGMIMEIEDRDGTR